MRSPHRYGGGTAYQLKLASFEEGATPRQQVVATAVVTKPKNSVEHLVPREFAAMSHSALAPLLKGHVVHAAATLTSDLLRKHKPTLHAHMQRHAPNYRLFDDALWTTGRLLFMHEGQSMPRHSDKENMPGTDGADLMLTFGEVGGADLTMHVADGEDVIVRGAETILADFLNEHELAVMTGSGLRVAFVFWQQRTVALSDHVVNTRQRNAAEGRYPPCDVSKLGCHVAKNELKIKIFFFTPCPFK